MRYSFVPAAILALASSVFAQASTTGFDVITSPTEGQKVVAGSAFDITWVPGDKPEYQNGTATIVLLQGSTQQDLQVGATIVSGVKNSLGKHTWNVPSNPGTFTTFGLRITLDDDKSTAAKEDTIFQYSFPFQIVAASNAGAGTITVNLGTGTAYTPEPTTTSTSILVITNTTIATQTTASVLPTNSSNFTLTSTLLGTSTRSTRVPTGTSSSTPTQSANAGVANAVSGGLMLAGGVLAAMML